MTGSALRGFPLGSSWCSRALKVGSHEEDRHISLVLIFVPFYGMKYLKFYPVVLP